MTDAQVEKRRKRLEQFLKDLLEPMGRSERRWGVIYIRGLLLNGERKSIEPARRAVGRGFGLQAEVQLLQGTQASGMWWSICGSLTGPISTTG